MVIIFAPLVYSLVSPPRDVTSLAALDRHPYRTSRMPPSVPVDIIGAPDLGAHTVILCSDPNSSGTTSPKPDSALSPIPRDLSQAFLGESWSGGVERTARGVKLVGNSRAFLVRAGTTKAHLNLLGKTLRFTVDVSRHASVQCAALPLVARWSLAALVAALTGPLRVCAIGEPRAVLSQRGLLLCLLA